MSKVIDLKAAKPRIERQRHAALVLDAFDRLKRHDDRVQKEKRAEVERKARKAF